MATIHGRTNSNSWTFRIDAYNINNYNIDDNTSTMRVDVWLGRASTASNSYVGGNWSGHISIDWETPNQYTVPISGTIPYPTTMNSGSWYYLATVDFTIKHNDDGNKTQRVVSEINHTEFTPSYCLADGNVQLVTIPRATDLPSLGVMTVEGVSYLQLTPKITNATHSVKLDFGNLRNWVQHDGSLGSSEVKHSNANIPILIPKEYYTQFSGPNAVGNIYLYTYNNNTKIGEKVKEFKVTCNPGLCTPIVDATAVDINELSVGLTGNENNIIANVSKILVTPTIQVSDTDDTTAYITSKSLDGAIFTTDTAIIFEPTTNKFLLNISNSRGFTGGKIISPTGDFIPYVLLTFNIEELYRPEPTESKIVLKYSGKFYSGDFSENNSNELTLWWKYKTNRDNKYIDGGILEPVIDTENNTYSGEVELGDIFDYQQQYDFQFFYKDKIVGINDDTYLPGKVTRGLPVFWWTADSFRIIGDLYVNDIKVIPGGNNDNDNDDSLSGIIYSTNEQVVGRWINGKPVYRRTITGSLVNLGTTWNNLYQVNDVDEVIDLTGSISNTGTDGRSLNANTWEDESHNCTFSHCKADNNMIQVRVTGWSNPAWKFVFKLHFLYTKTTDATTINLMNEEG